MRSLLHRFYYPEELQDIERDVYEVLGQLDTNEGVEITIVAKEDADEE